MGGVSAMGAIISYYKLCMMKIVYNCTYNTYIFEAGKFREFHKNFLKGSQILGVIRSNGKLVAFVNF